MARIRNATIVGVVALLFAVWAGRGVAGSSFGHYLKFSQSTLIYAICVYGFLASVLPVWLLLVPRDYLSAYMKLGTIAILVVGIMLVNPELKMDAVSEFVHGNGPIIPGKVFPFVFITIACGAISGFHSLIASGTTPKMIDKESDTRFIGYGAMLVEGLVGVTSLIAAASLYKADYFAINVDAGEVRPPRHDAGRSRFDDGGHRRGSARPHRRLGLARRRHRQDLLRPAGHEGAARLLVPLHRHVRGGVHPHHRRRRHARGALPRAGDARPASTRAFCKHDWAPGIYFSSALVVVAWGAFLRTGSISTLWPMLGIANQLLATTALCVGTTVIVNAGRARYAFVTLAPLAFVATTTLTAAYLSTVNNFLKLHNFQGWLDAAVSVALMVCTVAVLVASVRKWLLVTRAARA